MDSRQPHPELAPPVFLQLAGHPLRWRLLSELARSDRSVNEMMALVGEPQNLVSYHLGKLRDGRLVSGRRSSADRRDTYYRLELAHVGELLSAAGGALHPGLRLSPPARAHASIDPVKVLFKVLFLCTGNSARSQMAEALIRDRSGGTVQAFSAGSQPRPLHANAVRVMLDAFGLDISGHASKHLDMFAGQHFDWVITLCDKVREVCPEFPGTPEAVHWSIANPGDGDAPLFSQVAAELETRIAFLLAALADRTPREERRIT